MFFHRVPVTETRLHLSAFLVEVCLYTSNTTSILALPVPSSRASLNAESASCAKVLPSPSPLSLWTMLVPSMMQAEGGGNVSVCEALFSRFLASAALSILRIESSLFASDHGKGPSGCVRTSLTGRALHSAMTIIWVSVWLQSDLLPLSFNTSRCFLILSMVIRFCYFICP